MKLFPRLQRYHIRWPAAAAAIFIAVLLIFATQRILSVDTDIINAIPQNDPIIDDARYVLAHHPLQDRIVIDLSRQPHNMESLLAAAEYVENRLHESGLFRQIGTEDVIQEYPVLLVEIVRHLPVLFSEDDLKKKVAPLLDAKSLEEKLQRQMIQLQNAEGIGQADIMRKDPLELRNLALARLSPIAPAKGIGIVGGRLVSADGQHLMIVAEPAEASMASAASRRIAALIQSISVHLNAAGESGGASFTVTPMGAYRAALDNEERAKRDTHRAVIFSTVAIIFLLLAGFPRPIIGMLALLPAFAGTIAALFVFSLFHKSISMLAIGFGGAIISFTVDYGIAYLLFLDRPYETAGLDASREVWSLSLLAMLTTAGSFAFLFLSGFPALTQLGFFAALGVVFTFIFVHAAYPFIFPKIPPASRGVFRPFEKLVNAVTSSQSTAKAWAVLALFIVMIFFARPAFKSDLDSMNSVSPETKAAEALISNVWGEVLSRVYAVVEGDTLAAVRRKGDSMSESISQSTESGMIASAFLPSMLFPGEEKAAANFSAWRSFWTNERIGELKNNLSRTARTLGFAPDAFNPFLSALQSDESSSPEIPQALYSMMGLNHADKTGRWHMFATLTPAADYDAEALYRRLSHSGARVFDPSLFSKHLGDVIMNGFFKVCAIVAGLTVLIILFYVFDFLLTAVAFAPTLFAVVCTLATLNMIGEPLGVPVIMISAVVIGMGTDYALYLVVAWQRYLDEGNQSLALIRTSIFLSFCTTFLGFAVLSLSSHTMLRSIGLTLLLGIGYSFAGAAAIVPPVARRLFARKPWPQRSVEAGSKEHIRMVLERYRHLEAYTRMFARFKLRRDPMFSQLPKFVDKPSTILDIGCGYGVPAMWLLALHPQAHVFGIDPDKRRVRFAAHAVGSRGVFIEGAAPHIPSIGEKADTVLLLDIIHMLSDDELDLTLVNILESMTPNGRLILRCTIPFKDKSSLERRLEEKRLQRAGLPKYFRSSEEVDHALRKAGFQLISTETSSPSKELQWFIAGRRNC